MWEEAALECYVEHLPKVLKAFGVCLEGRMRCDELVNQIHKITNPGEYGLGSEPDSLSELTDKECFEAIGSLIEEYRSQLKEETK